MEEYNFHLIEFICRGRKPAERTKRLDFVPSHWIDYNPLTKKCFTRFPNPPYEDAAKQQEFHDLVYNQLQPLDDYSTYPVTIVGRAKTFQEAILKIDRLKSEQNVLSNDSETDPRAAEDNAALAVKKKKLMEKATRIKNDFLTNPETSGEAMKGLTQLTITEARESKKRKSNESILSQKSEIILTKTINSPKLRSNSPHSQPPDTLNQSFRTSTPTSTNAVRFRQSLNQLPSPSNDLDSQLISYNSVLGKEDTPTMSLSSDANEAQPRAKTKLFQKPLNQPTTPVNSPAESNLDIQFVISEISGLKLDVKRLVKDMQTVVKFIHEFGDSKGSPKRVCTAQQFFDCHKILLPIETQDRFEKFNEELVSNLLLQQNVNTLLRQCLDKDHNLSKSLTHMTQKFMCRSLAMSFTGSKKIGSKCPIAGTAFYLYMKNAIIEGRTTFNIQTCEKELLSKMGKVLSNARDWFGGRKITEEATVATADTADTTAEPVLLPESAFMDENGTLVLDYEDIQVESDQEVE